MRQINPGDFPVGSIESRAAARARLEKRTEPVVRVTIVHIGQDGSQPLPPPSRCDWGMPVLRSLFTWVGSQESE
jgi:hypothetical protein